MKLTIGICSTHNRYKTFLPKMLDQLFGQWNLLAEEDKKEVEIISIIDNKSMTIGTKRNRILEAATGTYIAFVDDDDRVSDNYLATLLHFTTVNTDVITFHVSVSLNNSLPKLCYYSREYPHDYNTADAYFRLPNHIMCVKRNLALQVKFPEINHGEDAAYAKNMHNLLKTEFKITTVLYHYDWNALTTES